MLQLIDFKTEVNKQTKKAGLNSRIPNWLWAVESRVFSMRPLWFMVASQTLTTVDGQAEYILDSRIDGRRISKMNDETEDAHITLDALATMLWRDPTPTEEGQPYSFAYQGLSRVQDQPDAAGTLSFASDDSSDTNKKVVVVGFSGGIEVTKTYETDGSNGTTSVTTADSFDADGITSIQVESGFAGTLTVTADSGSTTVVSIPPNTYYFEAPKIRFMNVPDSARTLRYYFYKKVKKLSSDYECPTVPEQFQWDICMNGVLSIAFYNNNDFQQGQLFEGKMNDGIRRFIAWCNPTGKSPYKNPPIMPSLRQLARYDYSEVDAVGTP